MKALRFVRTNYRSLLARKITKLREAFKLTLGHERTNLWRQFRELHAHQVAELKSNFSRIKKPLWRETNREDENHNYVYIS